MLTKFNTEKEIFFKLERYEITSSRKLALVFNQKRQEGQRIIDDSELASSSEELQKSLHKINKSITKLLRKNFIMLLRKKISIFLQNYTNFKISIQGLFFSDQTDPLVTFISSLINQIKTLSMSNAAELDLLLKELLAHLGKTLEKRERNFF